MSPRVTVITPTYQRVETLPRLYRSLLEQSYEDFEWLVVDDGSDDGTEELVRGWAAEGAVAIDYAWQPNAGKHVAVNNGVERARGEYCGLMDSDDWYAPDALARMVATWEEIPADRRARFSSVEGLCADQHGNLIGPHLPRPWLDSDSFEIEALHGIAGDKIGMHRREVLRQFPFPEDLGWHVTPAVVWNRIAARFQSRFVDEVWAYKEYLASGLSARDGELRLRFPEAQLIFWSEFAAMPRRMKRGVRYRANANRIRYLLLTGAGPAAILRGARKPAWALAALPAGAYLYARDRRRSRELRSGEAG
ncbi:MAG: glycosyltransferase family 2 protein [Solirubrobacterales bacterium]